ncbi:MAG: hypothetical protein L6Q92_03710 [Phycisphaerae bacterium]|nr:hypothetical protein [Phycisphaerae bacterium]
MFAGPVAESDRPRGETIEVKRADAVPAVSEHAEDRQAAQHPGDVVDQDVIAAEAHGRAQDRVRQARFAHVALQPARGNPPFRVSGGAGDRVRDGLHPCDLVGFQHRRGAVADESFQKFQKHCPGRPIVRIGQAKRSTRDPAMGKT